MKFLQFALIIATASVAYAQQVVPYQVSGVAGTDAEIDPHPKYEFQYSVADPVTGDQKSQVESRDGDKVQGYYTVVESDGSLRKVEYYADAVSGFTATVSHQPGGQAPPAPSTYQQYRPQEVVAPVKVVAPVAPVPVAVPAKVVPAPAPVRAPVQYYTTGQRYQPGYYNGYNQGYYQPGYYNGYQQGYYQPGYSGYYNQGYYQQPTYYSQSQPAYYNNAPASVSGYFSSPYANYALPGTGSPAAPITSSASKQ